MRALQKEYYNLMFVFENTDYFTSYSGERLFNNFNEYLELREEWTFYQVRDGLTRDIYKVTTYGSID